MLTLLDLVQQETHLSRCGKEWVGLCVFHLEKTPSFYVNEDKGVYFCRACGAGGDLVTWLVQKRGFTMREALRQAGKVLPVEDPRRQHDREALIEKFYTWRHEKLRAHNELLERLSFEYFAADMAVRAIRRSPQTWPPDEQAYWHTRYGELLFQWDVLVVQNLERLCDDAEAWAWWKEEDMG